jgi:hypothetical protein
MKSYLFFIALFICSFAKADNRGFPQQLPSTKDVNMQWDMFYEIEHKSEGILHKISDCISKNDLLNTFPARDNSGLYFDYVAKNHKNKNSTIFKLGLVDGLSIYEIVHSFSEPIDYIKILAFEHKDMLCPFLLISEWNMQMIYSQSYIQSNQITTKVIDNIAKQSHSIRQFNFTIENGLPKYAK